LTHVPYKGTAIAANALFAGEIQLSFDSISAALPHLKSGRLRALGIATRKPSALAPEIPTISDSGVPGFQGTTWQGMCAPAAISRPVMQVLSKAIVGAVRSPEIAQRFASLGVEGIGSSPEEFRAFIGTEHALWGKAIREAGIRNQ
ncbi:MAG: tripartite tricarboxylate transporter substrate binding protein, partial [Burkholderiales bacterium]|nr:tripartite tricarboxylate transporter substrate binding protein [Burkholderiales bacterium]